MKRSGMLSFVSFSILTILAAACSAQDDAKKQQTIEDEWVELADESGASDDPALHGDSGFPEMPGAEPVDPNSDEYKQVIGEFALATSLGQKIINAGLKYQGKPFEFGSKMGHFNSFDCSKFVYYAVRGAGLGKLPRTARGQVKYLNKKSSKYRFKPGLALDDLKKGDLVYWHLSDERVAPGIASHTSIYAGNYFGNHYLLHATRTYGVGVTRLYGSFLMEDKVVATFRLRKKLN